MVDKAIINEWMRLAEEDFSFASRNLDDPSNTYFGIICFHFQQSAEKYLKAYIVAHELSFEKVHDLGRLQQLCKTSDNMFDKIEKDCLLLNDFYIDARYPVIWPVGYTKSDAEKAKEAANTIRIFITSKLTTE